MNKNAKRLAKALLLSTGASVIFTGGVILGDWSAKNTVEARLKKGHPLLINAFSSVLTKVLNGDIPVESIREELQNEMKFIDIVMRREEAHVETD